VVTVNIGPLPLTGPFNVCAGATTYLSDVIAGGTWSSSNTRVATVDAFGLISGVAAGTSAISYSIGSCVATAIVTVAPVPAAISGISVLCVGLVTTLSDATTGGTWSSSGAASVGATSGIVTGTSGGVANISYILPGGCAAVSVVTVNSAPPAIGGTAHVCPGTHVRSPEVEAEPGAAAILR
jgi:uncharacterized protein YjdB